MNPFTQHPQQAGESYLQHLSNAMRYAVLLILNGFACFVHAFLPFLFKTNASDCVTGLYDELKARQERIGR